MMIPWIRVWQHRHRRAGDRHRDRGDAAAALAAYRRHLAHYPDDAAIWIQMGHLLKDGAELDQAETAYRQAVTIAPQDPDPVLHLAHLLKGQERFGEACATFKQLFLLTPEQTVLDELQYVTRQLRLLDGADSPGTGSEPVIDRAWLENICDLAEVEVAGVNRDRLPELLGDVTEVLPFVLVRGRGFSDWPLARAALSQAIQSFPRPRDIRANAPSNAFCQDLGDDGAAFPSPERRILYDRMRRTLVGSDVHWRPDWEERGVHVEELLDTVKAVRFDEQRGSDSPSMFITRD